MPQLKAVPSLFFFLSFCLIMLSFVQPTEAAQTEKQGEHRGQAKNRRSQTPNSFLSGALILLVPGAPLGIRAMRERPTYCYELAQSTQKSLSSCCQPATVGQTWWMTTVCKGTWNIWVCLHVWIHYLHVRLCLIYCLVSKASSARRSSLFCKVDQKPARGQKCINQSR